MDKSTDHIATRPSPSDIGKLRLISTLVLLIVFGVGGFVAGMQYEKNHGSKSSSTSLSTVNGTLPSNGFGSSGGFGGQNRSGTFGTVSAISGSSISVESIQSGSVKTYSISSSTTVSDNGTTVSSSSIAVGDKVIIMVSSSDSSVAASILLNPTIGNPSGTGFGQLGN